MNWYYVENGKQVGPVNDGILNRLLKERTVRPETLVWRDGMEKWVPYSQMTIGAEAVAAASATVCSECGRSFSPDELIPVENNLVCAACRPAAVQKLKEGAAFSGELDYAGFWIRAGAAIIDIFILYSVDFVLARGIETAFDMEHRAAKTVVDFSFAFMALAMLIQIAYFTFFVGRFAATPGKMACGLKVVRPDGTPLTYGRAFGRVFGEMLSRLTLGVGYLVVAFDEQKRALHDRVCDTRVIKI